uniref:Si:ch211-210c8.7 n=1 Tax=Neogobius melanostomus TaxID=47308 RepID=A0A8C6TIT4_9GOBI
MRVLEWSWSKGPLAQICQSTLPIPTIESASTTFPERNTHKQTGSGVNQSAKVTLFFLVVIAGILLTIAVVCFLLYRYLCHNKGDYRTTGELAPGEDFEEELHSKPVTEKKEYFI